MPQPSFGAPSPWASSMPGTTPGTASGIGNNGGAGMTGRLPPFLMQLLQNSGAMTPQTGGVMPQSSPTGQMPNVQAGGGTAPNMSSSVPVTGPADNSSGGGSMFNSPQPSPAATPRGGGWLPNIMNSRTPGGISPAGQLFR